MTKQNIQYVVKVLSGVNQGATAVLRNASGVVIGRSVGCDIIFNGANVADRHVAVELDGTRIRLTPLAQPVYVDGKDVGSREVILRPNQLVNIGVVDFTIADKNQPWPSINKSTGKVVTQRLGLSDRQSNTGSNGRSSNVKKSSRTSLLTNPWLWLALLTMVLANVHYLTRDYGGIPGVLGFKKTVKQQISEVINVDSYPSLYIKHLKNGATELKGYVATEAEKRRAEEQALSINPAILLHVFVDAEIERNARKIAQSLGESEISFSTLEHGRLKATGLAESRSKWLSIKDNIRTDVQGVTSINDDEVRNLNEMFLAIERKVSTESYSDRINLELRKGTILVKGKLTKSEKERWIEIKGKFLKNSFYPFKFREILRTPDADIKLSIRSVSVGDVPYVVSKEGNKYFQGSHVGSGYYIEAIADDHVLLKNNNIEFPVYFGQTRGSN